MLYVLNAFSPNMLSTSPAVVRFDRITIQEARGEVDSHGSVVCAIGHQGTAALASRLLGRELDCRRTEIRLGPGDTALIFVLAFRIPEGRVYSEEEVRQLYQQVRIAVWRARGP